MDVLAVLLGRPVGFDLDSYHLEYFTSQERPGQRVRAAVGNRVVFCL